MNNSNNNNLLSSTTKSNGKKKCSTIRHNENIDNSSGDRNMQEFLDTVVVVPEMSKIPEISKYLHKGKIANKSKTYNDNNLIRNYLYVFPYNNN